MHSVDVSTTPYHSRSWTDNACNVCRYRHRKVQPDRCADCSANKGVLWADEGGVGGLDEARLFVEVKVEGEVEVEKWKGR